jgi:hypothetical protein
MTTSVCKCHSSAAYSNGMTLCLLTFGVTASFHIYVIVPVSQVLSSCLFLRNNLPLSPSAWHFDRFIHLSTLNIRILFNWYLASCNGVPTRRYMTQCGRRLGMLIVAQLTNKFPSSHRTWCFTTYAPKAATSFRLGHAECILRCINVLLT